MHPNAKLSLEERFFGKTNRLANGCLLWIGAVTSKGYGSFWSDDKIRQAHHVAWMMKHGDYPEGNNSVVHHKCENTLCVEVNHLVLMSVSDHSSLSNQHARKLVCPKCGGPYTRRSDGYRRCMTCRKKYQASYNQKATYSYLSKRKNPMSKSISEMTKDELLAELHKLKK